MDISTIPWITYMLIFLSGSAKALSDLYEEGVLSPSKGESWKNKWKLDENRKIIPNKKRKWYYLWLFKPKYIEKFPYSSEFLVSLTDPWHRYNSLRIIFTIVSIITFKSNFNPMIDFLIIYSMFALGFTSLYNIVKAD